MVYYATAGAGPDGSGYGLRVLLQQFESGASSSSVIRPVPLVDTSDFGDVARPGTIGLPERSQPSVPGAVPQWGYGFPWNGYYFRFSIESGYLGGCISREVPHVGFMVHRVEQGRGTQILNIHIASWWNGSQACVGVYESASGFCRTVCTPHDWGRMQEAIVTSLAMVLAFWMGMELAKLAAVAAGGVVIAGLVVIPGVPPPP